MIKFGIIGLGNIGKRHAEHILNQPDARWIAYCDLKPQTDGIDIPHDVSFCASLQDMFLNHEIDVVCVCTPNYLHHQHTILALTLGAHVVCEKPMAISTQECDEMIEAAKISNRTIFVVKQNRYNEPVQQVKKLLENNLLGKTFFIQVNCFWNRNEHYYDESAWRGKKLLDGGCLFTQFSHFLDVLYYLFGDVCIKSGEVKNFNHAYTEVEDSGSFIMETLDGAIVNFNFSTCAFEKNMEGAITILGELGTIKIGGQYLNTIEYQHIKQITLPAISIQSKSNDYGRYQGSMSNHDKMIENVVRTLQGKATVMTNAQEGKKVVEIIEKMYKKAKGE